jgi:hypothetical protein
MLCEDIKLLPRWLGFRLLPELSIPNTHQKRKKEIEKEVGLNLARNIQ